jgi:hypothetical protein
MVTSAAIDRAINNAVSVIEANTRGIQIRIDGVEKAVEVFQSDLTRVPTQLDRAVMAVKDVLVTRFDGIDKDINQFHGEIDKRREDIRDATTHLRELMTGRVQELHSVTLERFAGVAAQFSERDTRTDQRAGDTKLAVDAAFAAAKEATAKIEAGFTKQIDALINLIDTKTANLAGGLGDIKDRMTAMENRTVGMVAANMVHRDDRTDHRGVIGVIVGGAALVISFVLPVVLHFVK